jgi:hypothetical protein
MPWSRYLAVWLPLVVLLTGVARFLGESPWTEAAALAVPLATVFAFLCLGAGYSCRVLPLSRTAAGRTVLSHAATALVSSALWVGLARLLGHLLEREDLFPGVLFRISRLSGSLMTLGVLIYLLAVAVHYLATAREESRLAEQRLLEAELSAREAELKALKAQIDPHFLFNSLNSINALVGRDPEAARQVCAGLGDLMRLNLQNGRKRWIALDEELGMVRMYLDLEKVRLGSRLQVTEQVDPAALPCRVPPLVLQPLVENALKHGIGSMIAGGMVTLSAGVGRGRLALKVTNPVDPGSPARPGTGTGLQNLRQRLVALYGNEAQLKTGVEHGTHSALVTLPADRGQDD